MNIISASAREYLWQGDARFWTDRSPVLFPLIARFTDNTYMYQGKKYHLPIHGFALSSEFAVDSHKKDEIVLSLTDNDDIYAAYPFIFCLRIKYKLIKNCLTVSYHVENHTDCVMPFGIGGHPGFLAANEVGEAFEDYYLEFSQNCQPDRVGFTPQLFLNSQDIPFPLADGKYIPLKHSLFDDDAVILKNMAREVTLKSRKHNRTVKVNYAQFPYLGIWHQPGTEAPYVCIEPWMSLPARQNIIEEISCKSDMIQLLPENSFDAKWSVTIHE